MNCRLMGHHCLSNCQIREGLSDCDLVQTCTKTIPSLNYIFRGQSLQLLCIITTGLWIKLSELKILIFSISQP